MWIILIIEHCFKEGKRPLIQLEALISTLVDGEVSGISNRTPEAIWREIKAQPDQKV